MSAQATWLNGHDRMLADRRRKQREITRDHLVAAAQSVALALEQLDAADGDPEQIDAIRGLGMLLAYMARAVTG